MNDHDRKVLITIEREGEVNRYLYRIHISDGTDWVPLEPQYTLSNAEGIAKDTADLMGRLGLKTQLAQIGFTNLVDLDAEKRSP